MDTTVRDLLPERFRFAHNYMLFLHDALAETIRWGEEANIFKSRANLSSKEHAAELQKLPQEELFDWLDKHGYKDLIRDIVYRNCCLALLSDFCHFLYEALSCSRKQKLAVAFALLRKPFKDNLFYFEWMVADREQFLNCFLAGDPHKLDPSSFQPADKLSMIQRTITDLALDDLYDAQTLHDLRYNKAAPEGLELLWNRANHLITTHKHLQTEPQNLNFIFQREGQNEGLWEHLYSRLPYVLAYAIDVIESAISQFSPIRANKEEVHGLRLRRAAGCILWMDTYETDQKGLRVKSMVESLKEIFGDECHNCKITLDFDEALLRTFYERGAFVCSKCAETHK